MTELREVREYWEERTGRFGKKAPVASNRGRIYNWMMTRAHRNQLKKALNISKPQSVLEIGVGQGRLLSEIGCELKVGIDVSINMLRRFHLSSNSTVLLQGEASHLPFKDGSFDLVYTCTVLLHIPTRFIQSVISEIKRITSNWIFVIEQLPCFQHLDKSYFEGGHCFPHKYQELFMLPVKYRGRLDRFEHEAILFQKP